MNSAGENREEKAAVRALLSDWAEAFSGSDVEAILGCYSQDAVLWGTFSSELRRTPEAIRDYFEPYFSMEVRKIVFEDLFIRIFGDTATGNGLYEVSLKREERVEEVMTRYSFTCLKRDGRWRIVDHHSSVVPN